MPSELESAEALAIRLVGQKPIMHRYRDILTGWGKDHHEAGRREADLEACGRGQHLANRPAGCACGHMPPMKLRFDDDPFIEVPAPEPSADTPIAPLNFDPRNTEPGVERSPLERVFIDGEPLAEQPPSLVERIVSTFPDLNIPHSTQEQAAIGMLAEAVDALTARADAVLLRIETVEETHRLTESRTYKANERLDALEERVTGLSGPDTTPVAAPPDGGA